MTIKYYANADTSGNIIGFYNDDVWAVAKIPLTAIPVTIEEWQDAVNNPGKYNVQNGKLTIAPPAPQPTLTDAKQVKINKLNEACNAEILSGFTSSALGAANTYDFDYEAQTNLGGMLNAITAGIVTAEPISWKASGVPVNHTFAQFKTLFADGLIHKNTLIQKYWTLKAQVNAATTQAGIDAIVWS